MPKGATPVISVFILGGTGKQKNLASLRDILRKNCTLTLIGEQQIIRRCGVRAMTLGMSSKDTLTLSSITPDSAVLCLQRAISDLFGSTLDPVEIPLSLSHRYDAFSILCAAAIFLLSGKIDILKQILF